MMHTPSIEAQHQSTERPQGQPVQVGLLGLGTVGTGVFKILSRFSHVNIAKIAVRDRQKARKVGLESLDARFDEVATIVQDPAIDLVIEVMGGKETAYHAIRSALETGKHVVTANKVVIAHYGPELFALASRQGVNLLFEAAVAGGIPIILPLKTSLAGNRIEQIAGILNGTTNYILTRMEQAGLDFAAALQEAQAKGFAEADPTADVEGHDAACKIAILASIAYQQQLSQEAVYTEGISTIGALDIEMARDLGYAVRLIALAKATPQQQVDLRVHPMLVPLAHPLSKIVFENNAIWIKGDAVGEVMFYGKGAGELPTASAVCGDVLLIAQAVQSGYKALPGLSFQVSGPGQVLPMASTQNAYYIRLEAEDKPGVIGNLGKACGEHQVSLDAVMQKGTHPETDSATIVLLTHQVEESRMQAALAEIRKQSTTRKIHTVLRVFAP